MREESDAVSHNKSSWVTATSCQSSPKMGPPDVQFIETKYFLMTSLAVLGAGGWCLFKCVLSLAPLAPLQLFILHANVICQPPHNIQINIHLLHQLGIVSGWEVEQKSLGSVGWSGRWPARVCQNQELFLCNYLHFVITELNSISFVVGSNEEGWDTDLFIIQLDIYLIL